MRPTAGCETLVISMQANLLNPFGYNTKSCCSYKSILGPAPQEWLRPAHFLAPFQKMTMSSSLDMCIPWTVWFISTLSWSGLHWHLCYGMYAPVFCEYVNKQYVYCYIQVTIFPLRLYNRYVLTWISAQVSTCWHRTSTRGMYWIGQKLLIFLDQMQLEVCLGKFYSRQVGSEVEETTLSQLSSWHSWTCFMILEIIGVITWHSMLWGKRVCTTYMYCTVCTYMHNALILYYTCLPQYLG